MKIAFISILMLIVGFNSFGQARKALLEINPYIRKDWYPQFSYEINSINTNFVTIEGTSWGIDLAYKIPVAKTGFIKAGIGYYKHAFNKMNNYTNRFGENSTRNIHFPSNLFIMFYTDNYWYNCISANVGAEKMFELKNNWQLLAGINLNNRYTYSQRYQITYNNPDNPISNPYKRNQNRFFSHSTTAQLAILKNIGKANVGPSIILPLFDTWKQDNALWMESNADARSKWLRGLGVGIACNFKLN